MMLQMPRFGKDYKMFEKIIPSLKLDIGSIINDSLCYLMEWFKTVLYSHSIVDSLGVELDNIKLCVCVCVCSASCV
jgi:hypothetical protein